MSVNVVPVNRITRSYKCPIFRGKTRIECMTDGGHIPVLSPLPFYVLCGLIGSLVWRRAYGEKSPHTKLTAIDVIGLYLAAVVTDIIVRVSDVQEVDLVSFLLMPIVWGSIVVFHDKSRGFAITRGALVMRWVSIMVTMIAVSLTGL